MSLVEAYLKDHETAWAETTMKSERARLKVFCEGEKPEDLYARVKDSMKPYAIKTLFVRLKHLEAWSERNMGYREFYRKHKNVFKHAYMKKEIGVSYEVALRSLENLGTIGKDAMSLLRSGVRISEFFATRNGLVKGKGGKTRRVYGTIEPSVSKGRLRAQLKAVGLKPHDLRKLCATRLAERGASAADLCKIMGWSSITTAFQYLQAREDNKLRALVEESFEGP